MKYEIVGNPFPVVVCNLEGGETVKCQSGAMCWMSPNMKMETKTGGLGKMLGKALTGESLLENNYSAQGGPGMIAFGSGVPGNILPVDVSGGKAIIAQKKSFLASESGANNEIFFQKRLGSGLLGGEGFVMQKFSGQGNVFLEIDGSVVTYDLQPGQQLIVDTGYLAAMTADVHMEIQTVPGLKNKLLGGEGFFNTVLTGPGTVYLQSMPISAVAGSLSPYFPTGN